jgi:3-isopropylmalate/(R)-2-methylmalate dehydratase large subunit
MDERMTICNMSIEGGARVGYVNPDETTFATSKGRPFAPQGEAFERARRVVALDGLRPRRGLRRRGGDRRGALEPTSRGASIPGSRCVSVDEALPAGRATRRRGDGRRSRRRWFMGFAAGRRSPARRSTSRSSARAPTRGSRTCARPHASCAAATWRRVKALVVPGSQACGGGRAEGLDRVFARPASSGAAPAARCASA